MKKFSLYTLIGLLFCNVGFAECVEGDCINGQGTYTLASGGKYIGEFKDNKYHGKGTTTLTSGEKYVGEYKDGKYHGQGTYTFTDGEKYVGEWKDGNFVK